MRSAIRIFFLLVAAASAEEPFSFARTPGKLPKSIVPLRYSIHIEPKMAEATLRGSETIEIEVREPVRAIVLNSLNLEIDKAVLHGVKAIALTPKLDAAQQTLSLQLDAELPAGKYTLELEFHGKLNEQPEGLFLTRYQVGGKDKFALATQFEATDARRMFPCWDEPVFRAVFQLTAVIPEKHTAISNMPVEREKSLDYGRKEIAFAPSPSMVSYLLAFAAGEFEVLRGEADGIQLGIYFTEGKREQARYALEVTKQVLPYYNEYFGQRYPLPKLDQISFANTAAGGMENWGCIIYSDTAFLYDPQSSSLGTKHGVFAVIAHELAHQWFGDLVTMAWWDNLWLNEGFASWMGTKATDRFNPDWHVWTRAAGAKEHAMALDARATTHSIQQPVTNESQAAEAFDEITYQKGQSFIRMLESYLGEEPFREGIRRYMARHKFGNTTTADLWIALAEVSGQPVREFAASWTEQPGYPVVNVARQSGAAPTLSLTQEHFTMPPAKAQPLSWKIPILLGKALPPHDTQLVTLAAKHLTGLAVDPSSLLKANLGDAGYFRVQYDETLFAPLLEHATELAEADRLNLLNDTWALVRSGREPAMSYLQLASRLRADSSYAVIDQITDALWFIDGLARGRSELGSFRQWARQLLAPQLEKLGWTARPGESPLDDLRRNAVIRVLGGFGDESVLQEARDRFKRSLEKPESLTGDLRDTVWWLVGRGADEATYGQLHALAKKTESIEQKRNLYAALGAALSPTLARQTLDLSLTDELPPQHAAHLVTRVAGGGEHTDLAWDFAREHFDVLRAKLSFFQARDYVPDIFDHFSDAARADELEEWTRQNLPPDAATLTARTAEAIRFKAALKERLVPQIGAWCRENPQP